MQWASVSAYYVLHIGRFPRRPVTRLGQQGEVGLPDAFCKNTGHFNLSTVPDRSCVVFRKGYRENRETISTPVFCLAHYIWCVCDVTIAPWIASTAANKLCCPDKIHYQSQYNLIILF